MSDDPWPLWSVTKSRAEMREMYPDPEERFGMKDGYGLPGIMPVGKPTYEAYWEAREKIAWERPKWERLPVGWVTWLNARIMLRRLREGRDVLA